MAKPTPYPLYNARALATAALAHILGEGKGLEMVWSDLTQQADLREQELGWARHALLTTLRYLGPADVWIAQHLRKPLGEKGRYVQAVLQLGVIQLAVLEEPPHAVVNEAVQLSKEAGFQGLSGMVNAVLKKTGDFAPKEAEWIPDWWVQQGVDPRGVGQVLKSGKPPLDITVVSDKEQWQKTLNAQAVYGSSLRLQDAAEVTRLEGFAEGKWWVQDVAATLPAHMLGELRGKRVLDLCAAPGGKTAQLVAAGAEVTALDRSSHRLKRLKENMQRLDMQPEIIQADALKWQPDALFDAILLDAPCSAIGTFRRNPDVLWTRDAESIDSLVTLQRDLISRAAEWLTPGGVLVYAVCSLFPAEGEAQAEWIAANTNLTPSPITPAEGLSVEWVNDAGQLRTHPRMLAEQGYLDGFFAARFTKAA